ncbi:MAG: 50S ribosomal protein L9 [Anaerolineae bacterium]|jgi:large subunit ribosomal protein L9
MRVILTNNVPKLGEVGDVCNVAPGYGRNYLIPQGLAILATPGAVKQIDDLKRTEARRQDKIRAEMSDFGQRIGNLHLSFTAKVGETGRLYGSITAANIADEIEAELGEPVDRRKIILDESIRTLGSHVVPIHLMPGVDAAVHLEVVADEEIVPDIGLTAELDTEEAGEEADGEPAAEPYGMAPDAAADVAAPIATDDPSEWADAPDAEGESQPPEE